MKPSSLSPRSRRVLAALLAAGGLAALAVPALRPDVPPAVSVRALTGYWLASPASRHANLPYFATDRTFAAAALVKDAEWTLTSDALLVLAAGLPADRVEARRRMAAYILAPRRVVIALRREPEPEFQLLPVSPDLAGKAPSR